MRTSKVRELLQQGREGEKAAAKVCRDLHERRLMQDTNIILQMMIDHCVNSDFEWPVAADEGALMWYYMGKSRNAPKIREEHNREVIDLHNCSRGLASVTLVDRLLLLRSKWIEADPDADIVKGGVLVVVGKGKGTGKGAGTSSKFDSTVPVLKGAAMRLLNGRLNLAAVVNPSNRGSLLIKKKNLLRWFESDQALEWSREVSQFERSRARGNNTCGFVNRRIAGSTESDLIFSIYSLVSSQAPIPRRRAAACRCDTGPRTGRERWVRWFPTHG